jgi:hypothetical protein
MVDMPLMRFYSGMSLPGNLPWQVSTGRPIDSELYYNAIGIFRDQAAVDAYPSWPGAEPGDIIFEDVNEDGMIDALDRVRRERTTFHDLMVVLNLSFTWKNFDMYRPYSLRL